jgi:hypothetical protein
MTGKTALGLWALVGLALASVVSGCGHHLREYRVELAVESPSSVVWAMPRVYLCESEGVQWQDFEEQSVAADGFGQVMVQVEGGGCEFTVSSYEGGVILLTQVVSLFQEAPSPVDLWLGLGNESQQWSWFKSRWIDGQLVLEEIVNDGGVVRNGRRRGVWEQTDSSVVTRSGERATIWRVRIQGDE